MLYHYTIADRLPVILEEGFVTPATAGVIPPERPAVWFTRETSYPFSAAKSFIDNNGSVVALSPEEMVRAGMVLVRLVFPDSVASIGWRDWRKRSRINPSYARSLYETAVNAGDAPWLWRVSFRPVALQRMTRIEAYRPHLEQWEEISEGSFFIRSRA